MAKKIEYVLELPVKFSNVNVGDRTARIGVSISRGNLTVAKADKNLCEKRLTGKILARPTGAVAEQTSLPGLEDSDLELSGSFDVKSFTAGGKAITTGLTFNLSTIDVKTLSLFAKREGMLYVEGVEALPEDSEDETTEE